MYRVLKFDGSDGEICLVKEEGLTPRKKETVWPPFKLTTEYNKRSKDGIQPDSKSWLSYKIKRTFYTTGDITKAREKLKEAEVDSDVQTDANETLTGVTRTPRQKRRFISDESSDEESSSIDKVSSENLKKIRKSIPLFPNTTASTSSNINEIGSSQTGSQENLRDLEESELQTTIKDNSALSDSNGQDSAKNSETVSTGFEVITRRLDKIEKSIEDILKNQRIILNHFLPTECVASYNEEFDELKLPAESIDDVRMLENWLQASKNEQLMEKSLVLRGGKSLKQVTHRILETLFSNTIAHSYNWTGKGGKEPLKSLNKIITVIQRAVRRNIYLKEATDIDIISSISNWFRFAKDRDGGRERRRNVHYSCPDSGKALQDIKGE